jgi:hypothetical protein
MDQQISLAKVACLGVSAGKQQLPNLCEVRQGLGVYIAGAGSA